MLLQKFVFPSIECLNDALTHLKHSYPNLLIIAKPQLLQLYVESLNSITFDARIESFMLNHGGKILND